MTESPAIEPWSAPGYCRVDDVLARSAPPVHVLRGGGRFDQRLRLALRDEHREPGEATLVDIHAGVLEGQRAEEDRRPGTACGATFTPEG